jgi:hypothetical protein
MKKNFTRLLWTVLSLFFISFQSQAQSGQALNFVPNQYATLPSNILSGIGTGNFTIEAWVFWRGGGDWQRVFDIGTGTSNYMYLSVSGVLVAGNPQEIVFGWAMNGHTERRVTSAFAMPVGVWTHIAVTVDYANPLDPKAYMYVNGVKTGPSPQDMFDIAEPVPYTPYTVAGMGATTNNWLGKSEFPTDSYFNGAIDELRISNTLRYTSNFTPANTFTDDVNTTALYHFEDVPTSQTAANSAILSGLGVGPITLGTTTAIEPGVDATFISLSVLPVYILNFDAQKAGNSVKVQWKVYSTGEGGQFVIERSRDGNKFETVGTRDIPNSQGIFSFTLEDRSFPSGKNYYRLKVLENNSQPKFSNIVAVDAFTALFTAYPTVTSSQLFVQLPQATTISIFNSNGAMVKRVQLANSQNIDVSNLAKGSYQVLFEGTKESVRFIKL